MVDSTELAVTLLWSAISWLIDEDNYLGWLIGWVILLNVWHFGGRVVMLARRKSNNP